MKKNPFEHIAHLLGEAWYYQSLACAYSSSLELMHNTMTVEWLHWIHVAGLFPQSYHLTTAYGAASILKEGEIRLMPLFGIVCGCARNTAIYGEIILAMIPNLEKELNTIELSPEQKIYLKKFEENIKPICKLAWQVYDECIKIAGGKTAFEKLMGPHIEMAHKMHQYRIEKGFEVTPTIGPLRGIPQVFPRLSQHLEVLETARKGKRTCQK